MTPTQLLIDADILTYKTCWAVEEQYHWDDDVITFATNLNDLKYTVDHMIQEYREKFECISLLLAFSDYKNNFRKDLSLSYKLHRVGNRKPLGFQQLTAYLKNRYPYCLYPGLEADDVLGIHQTETTIIVSIDKDMLTIPGWHYNPDKETTQYVTEGQADYNWNTQTLVGDTTDGYPGCPGVGKVNAARILTEPHTYPWDAIVEAYNSKGFTEEEAILQARLARILRADDYDIEKQEVKLWTPNALSRSTKLQG